MTKQLLALAFAAAFGVAHAADVKPAVMAKPTAMKVAGDAQKTGPDAAVGHSPESTLPTDGSAPKATHKNTHKNTHKGTHHNSTHKKETHKKSEQPAANSDTATPSNTQ